jgi:hypothetical protein
MGHLSIIQGAAEKLASIKTTMINSDTASELIIIVWEITKHFIYLNTVFELIIVVV